MWTFSGCCPNLHLLYRFPLHALFFFFFSRSRSRVSLFTFDFFFGSPCHFPRSLETLKVSFSGIIKFIMVYYKVFCVWRIFCINSICQCSDCGCLRDYCYKLHLVLFRLFHQFFHQFNSTSRRLCPGKSTAELLSIGGLYTGVSILAEL